jgi:hypothetical protein
VSLPWDTVPAYDREVELTTLTIGAGNTKDNVVSVASLPYDAMNASASFVKRFSGSRFMRCRGEIIIDAAAQPYLVGAGIFSYEPYTQPGDTGQNYSKAAAASQCNGVYISFQRTLNHTFPCEFCFPQPFWDANGVTPGTVQLGLVRYTGLSAPIDRSGAGTATFAIRVRFRFLGIKLHGYDPNVAWPGPTPDAPLAAQTRSRPRPHPVDSVSPPVPSDPSDGEEFHNLSLESCYDEFVCDCDNCYTGTFCDRSAFQLVLDPRFPPKFEWIDFHRCRTCELPFHSAGLTSPTCTCTSAPVDNLSAAKPDFGPTGPYAGLSAATRKRLEDDYDQNGPEGTIPSDFDNLSSATTSTIKAEDSTPKPKEKKPEKKKPDKPTSSKEAVAKQSSVLTGTAPAQGKSEGDWWSTLWNGVTNVAGVVGNTLVGVIPYAKDLLPGVGAMLLDLPVDERPPTMTIESAPDWQHTRGLNLGHVLSTWKDSMASLPVGCTPSCEELCRRPAFVRQVTFDKTTTAGTDVATFNVNPFWICERSRTGAGPFAYVFNHTACSYISEWFQMFRPDFFFGAFAELGPAEEVTFAAYILPFGAAALTLASLQDVPRVEWHFVGAGYMACRVCDCSNNVQTPLGAITGAAPSAPQIACDLHIMLTQPLSVSSAASSTSYLNFFCAAGPDFRLYSYIGPGFRPLTTAFSGTDSPLPTTRKEWHKLLDDMKKHSPERAQEAHELETILKGEEYENLCSISTMFADSVPEPVYKRQSNTVPGRITTEPTETNLKALMQRAYYASQLSAGARFVGLVSESADLQVLAGIFKFCSGSQVYHLDCTGTTVPAWVTATRAPFGVHLTSFDQQYSAGAVFKGVDVLHRRHSFVLPMNRNHFFDEVWLNVLSHTSAIELQADNYAPNINVLRSVGDDFRLLCPLAPPQESFSAASIPTPSSPDREVAFHLELSTLKGKNLLLPRLRAAAKDFVARERDHKARRPNPSPPPKIPTAPAPK